VQSHWTYTLPEDVENLTLVGKGPNSAMGNDLNTIVIGNANKNVVDGGAGNDELSGGGGNDTFFVSGKDTIKDFFAGDQVNLQDFSSFTNFAKVKAAMSQVGSDTLLKLSASESVLFEDMSVSQFSSDMFVLGNPVDNYDLVFADDFDTFTLNLGTGSTDSWHPLYPRPGLSGHTTIGRSVQYFTYAEDEGTAGEPVGIDPFSLKNGILTITTRPCRARGPVEGLRLRLHVRQYHQHRQLSPDLRLLRDPRGSGPLWRQHLLHRQRRNDSPGVR